MTHVRYCSFGIGSPEPALAAVDRALLATTQNDLATGNKVNSALDNPTEYFTAQGLNNRASDISNLLDGIGNGVQVLQAANTGITSLQSLVASAQSIANQVLQSPIGYSTKSNVTSVADHRRQRATTCSAPVPATPMRPLTARLRPHRDGGLHQRGGDARYCHRRRQNVDHHDAATCCPAVRRPIDGLGTALTTAR